MTPEPNETTASRPVAASTPASVARSRPSLAERARWALAGATVATVAHVVVTWFRGRALHEFTWATRDLPWMSLIGNAIIFGVVAVLLVLAGRVWRPEGGRATMVFVNGLLAALSVLLLFPSIWQYASLLLALGVAYQLTRASARAPERLTRRVGVASVVFGTLACVFAAVSAWPHLRERSETVRPPASTDVPNVLFVILDTVRAASMSLYGYGLPTTPSLDSLARESVVFDRAYATAPWTLPSHCSFFTGRYAHDVSCRWASPLDAAPTTLAEVLRERGYRTGGFVANHFYTTWETGLARGFDRWQDFQVSWKELFCSTVLAQTGIVRSAVWGHGAAERWRGLLRFRLRGDPKPEHDRKSADIVNREFLTWLDERPGAPFFAFLNYFDAHDPFRPPPPFDTRFPAGPNERGRYEGGLAFIDQEIGVLMADLRRRGLLDRTLVIVASDHGEMFGEHDLFGHGNALYTPLLHVPLLVRLPGQVPAGVRVAHTVSLRDLPATIADLTGAPIDGKLGGTSLRATWAGGGDTARVSPVVAEVEKGKNWWGKEPARFDSLQTLVESHYQLIRTFGGTEQLFDLTDTTSTRRDLAASPEGARLREAMRGTLLRATSRPMIAAPAASAAASRVRAP